MNRREQAVLLLLTAAFLIGAGVSHFRRVALKRQAALSPIAVVDDMSAARSTDSSVARAPVDLNQATLRELDRLPGIGPVLAARIVEYRQHRGGFRRVSDLQAVTGIGEKKYSALKDLVTVGSAGPATDSGR